MIEITVKEENKKEHTYKTANYILAVDAGDTLAKLAAIHVDTAPHMLAALLSLIGAAGQKMDMSIPQVIDLLKETCKFCEGTEVNINELN